MLPANYIPVFTSRNCLTKPFYIHLEPTGEGVLLLPGDELTVYQDASEYVELVTPLENWIQDDGLQVSTFDDYRLFINGQEDSNSVWITKKILDYCDTEKVLLAVSTKARYLLHRGTFARYLEGHLNDTVYAKRTFELSTLQIHGAIIGSGGTSRWFFRWRHADFPKHYPDARTVFDVVDQIDDSRNLEVTHYLLPRSMGEYYTDLWNTKIIATLELRLIENE